MGIQKIITIGRSGDSDRCVDGESVSNSHAMIIVAKGGKCLLIDCDSTNGTRLPARYGEKRISQCEVHMDDLMFFGDEKFSLRDILNKPKSAGARDDFTRYRDPIDGSIKSRPRQ